MTEELKKKAIEISTKLAKEAASDFGGEIPVDRLALYFERAFYDGYGQNAYDQKRLRIRGSRTMRSPFVPIMLRPGEHDVAQRRMYTVPYSKYGGPLGRKG